jgi:hypothetical protein
MGRFKKEKNQHKIILPEGRKLAVVGHGINLGDR